MGNLQRTIRPLVAFMVYASILAVLVPRVDAPWAKALLISTLPLLGIIWYIARLRHDSNS